MFELCVVCISSNSTHLLFHFCVVPHRFSNFQIQNKIAQRQISRSMIVANFKFIHKIINGNAIVDKKKNTKSFVILRFWMKSEMILGKN